VTGVIDLSAIKTKGGSKPGEVLILTKPLGTGVVTTALKQEVARPEDVAAAVESMKKLNSKAAEAAEAAGVNSMTDITGFGLLGHAHEMAHLGQVDFRLFISDLPWLPGAIESGMNGAFPGGMANNLNYFSPWVTFESGVTNLMQDMLWTPETSGGLLAAVPESEVSGFLDLLPDAVIVGQVLPGDGHIHVVDSSG
jgi:selenide,water dikinase